MNNAHNKLEKLLKNIDKKIKENTNYQTDIKNWIDTYTGKIIGFQVGDDSFYFVFKRNGDFEIRKGEYPSCDAFFQGSYENIENILLKKTDSKKLINQSILSFYGNYNEFVSFKGLFP